MIKTELYLNDKVFFVISEGDIIIWDYESHKQFVLSFEAFKVIIYPNLRSHYPEIVSELLEKGILISEDRKIDHNWDWDILSKIFHFGTSRPIPEKEIDRMEASFGYLEYCESIVDKIPSNAFQTVRGINPIKLKSDNSLVSSELIELLEKRRTNRTFTGEDISLEKISIILNETFGYRDHNIKSYEEMGMFTPTRRRSSPSGGSLQSCEVYLLSKRVAKLNSGVYHYQSHSSELCFIKSLEGEFNFGAILGGQMFAEDLSAILVITCRFDKLMWKYNQSRSYRVALMDAGHLSQTAQLLATSLNLRTWVTGAFYDHSLSTLIGADHENNEFPLLVIGIGTGPFNTFDKDLGKGFANQ